MIGSARSIFWICGYNDLVRLVDDPACILDDEVVKVPRGTHPGTFLVDRYWEAGKIPGFVYDRYSGFLRDTTIFRVGAVFEVPQQVLSDQATPQCTTDIYPLGRQQTLPNTVLCVRVKYYKNTDKIFKEIRQKLGESLDMNGSNLWFRGLSLHAITLSMSFFIPVIKSNNNDNEFGPGIYAANDFDTAASYACSNGAIMIFKNPDFRGLTLWEPNESDWNVLTAIWLRLPLNNLNMPEKHMQADVILGPLSANQADARKKKCFAKQSDEMQIACVSYESCRRLAASLVAIVYVIP
jgi:hypothetical protein